jgi:membrane protease subunit HflK
VLENLASREVTRYLAGVDFFEFLSEGREEAAAELRRRMQNAADEAGLGVNILFVGLQGVHPPVKVGKDFNAVVAALQERDAISQRARGYAATNVILARAEATNRLAQAEVYRIRQIAGKFAEAAEFTNRIKAYREAPEVYAQRAYLAALAEGAQKARKVILTSTNAHGVFNVNLEDKLRPDLLDVTFEPKNP